MVTGMDTQREIMWPFATDDYSPLLTQRGIAHRVGRVARGHAEPRPRWLSKPAVDEHGDGTEPGVPAGLTLERGAG
jgi:hypothetical protein